jgi:hypothetical protein
MPGASQKSLRWKKKIFPGDAQDISRERHLGVSMLHDIS